MQRRATLVFALLILEPCILATATANDTPPCAPHAAIIEARSGRVEVRRADSKVWSSASRGEVLCYGDELRTKPGGGVVLRTPDGTEHRFEDVDGGHLTFPPPDEKSVELGLVDGFIYVLSQDSRELGVRTPFANGGPEGTEFVASADERHAQFALVDGAVVVASETDSGRVSAGERLSVGEDGVVGAPEASPLDLLPWAYFPRLLAGVLPLPDEEPADNGDMDFFVRRAAAWLEAGGVENALADLDRAAAIGAGDPRVHALRAIVALVGRDQARAEAFVASALRSDPDSVEALLASSHVLQAAGSHAAAVRAGRRAVDLDPTNGLAWARLAESYFAVENYRDSVAAAREAARVAPSSGEAFTVLGFAHYAQRQLDAALAAFERAIELDSMAPNAWHGTALVLWQQRRRDEARDAAEVALILDPASVDTRSALAKFYDAEARGMLSDEQLDLAEFLTPNDPTPPLLRAYRDQSLANPIEAWREYRRAIERNAGRPPSRSTFALEADPATEAFGLSRIFIDLDAPDLGNAVMREKWAEDIRNPSAHLLSADLAALEPFSQQVSTDDFYLFSLLTPSIETPASPQRDQLVSPYARIATPRVLTTPDTDVPLSQDGVEASFYMLAGTRGNEGASASFAFNKNRYAIEAAAFDNESDGYRPNQDSAEQGVSLRAKFAPDPANTVVLDLISFETETGDLTDRFNSDYFGRNLRLLHDADIIRLALRRDFAAINRARPEWDATFLVSGVATKHSLMFDTGPFLLAAAGREQSLAIRHILQTDEFTLDVGAAVNIGTTDRRTTFTPVQRSRDEQRTFYVYVDRKVGDSLTLTVGLNSDDWSLAGYDGGKLNGKLAIVYEPTQRTTFRVAFIESPPPPVASTTRNNGQPGLERTRVAGFSQRVYPNADWTRTRWGAVEHEFSAALSAGITYRERSLLRPLFVNGTERVLLDLDESFARVHAEWFVSSNVSVVAAFERDAYANQPGLADFTEFETDRATLDVNWFAGNGLSIGGRVAYVNQEGIFITRPGVSYAPGDSEFVLLDTSISYRLPNRRIVVDFGVNNVLDKRFEYQEPEYDYATLLPARTAFVTLMYKLH